MSEWDWKPSVMIGCAALAVVYAWAVRFRFSRARATAWFAGVLLIGVALVSPLDHLADTYLFSMHMAKHILFVLVVPALLLMGLPAEPVERALHYPVIAGIERFLSTPAIAWAGGVGAMIFWHIPALFNAALGYEPLHIIEHLWLLIGGTIFWWPILAPVPAARMQPVPQGIAYLFTACLACTTIGVLITFSPKLLYPAYSNPAVRDHWGISPAMDQQIGGLLMWVPGCLIYLTGIMAMFARWYGEEEHITAALQQQDHQWT